MTSSSPFIRLLRPSARFVAWIQSRKGEEADEGEKKEKKRRETMQRGKPAGFSMTPSNNPNIQNIETGEKGRVGSLDLDLGF